MLRISVGAAANRGTNCTHKTKMHSLCSGLSGEAYSSCKKRNYQHKIFLFISSPVTGPCNINNHNKMQATSPLLSVGERTHEPES